MMTTARRLLAFLALVLFCTAWWAAFLTLTAFGILLALSGACAVAAGALGHIEGQRQRADCGYSETPFGRTPPPYVQRVDADPAPVAGRVVHTPAVALTVIEGGKKPVWPNAAGAPE